MSRSPVALLLVLLSLTGCGKESKATGVETNAQAEASTWFPVAAFRDDIRLPEASQARPWQPPAKGPVPVVEILRDGSWVVDGELLEGQADTRPGELRKRLADAAKAMPRETLFEELPGWTIPSNPILLRVDSSAPWSAMLDVIVSCRLAGIQIYRVDLQVGDDGNPPTEILQLTFSKDYGGCLPGSSYSRELWTLAADTDVSEWAGDSRYLPVDVHIVVTSRFEQGHQDTLSERSLSDPHEFVALLRSLAARPHADVNLVLPPDAPSWVGTTALDLLDAGGVTTHYGFPGPPDALEPFRSR